jgi:hypothetical protein
MYQPTRVSFVNIRDARATTFRLVKSHQIGIDRESSK